MTIKVKVLPLTNIVHTFLHPCEEIKILHFILGKKCTKLSTHLPSSVCLSLSLSLSFSLCYAQYDLSTVVQLRITRVGKEDHLEENIRSHTKLYFKHLTSDVRLQWQKRKTKQMI